MRVRALCWVVADAPEDARAYPLPFFRKKLREFKLEVLPLSQHGIDIYRVGEDGCEVVPEPARTQAGVRVVGG